MCNLKVIVVLVFVSAGAISTGADMDEVSEHIKRVSTSKYPCSAPQPRVMYLRDIIGDELWENKYKNDMRDIRPFHTVLHRCEGSGCCSRYNQRCKPADTQTVTLKYVVITKQRFVEFPAENHTSCHCEEISDNLIK
uniref:Uncharacterized protein LOC114344259 n=1 Tax=Diabrotica virgifera virgifera TaxID=50390 RepID=A0A6P7H4H5_DIAVI